MTLARTDATDGGGPIATLQALDNNSQEVLAEHALEIRAAQSGLQAVIAPFAIPGPDARRVRFRVLSTGRTAWKLAAFGVSVDYGLEVLDLTERLNTFDTHASLFDAHPNTAAHKVMADEVYRVVTGR